MHSLSEPTYVHVYGNIDTSIAYQTRIKRHTHTNNLTRKMQSHRYASRRHRRRRRQRPGCSGRVTHARRIIPRAIRTHADHLLPPPSPCVRIPGPGQWHLAAVRVVRMCMCVCSGIAKSTQIVQIFACTRTDAHAKLEQPRFNFLDLTNQSDGDDDEFARRRRRRRRLGIGAFPCSNVRARRPTNARATNNFPRNQI